MIVVNVEVVALFVMFLLPRRDVKRGVYAAIVVDVVGVVPLLVVFLLPRREVKSGVYAAVVVVASLVVILRLPGRVVKSGVYTDVVTSGAGAAAPRDRKGRTAKRYVASILQR